MNKYKMTFKRFAQEYGAYIPILTVVVPFLFALVIILAMTYGNIQATNYVLQNVGLFDIWVKGLIYISVPIMQIALLLIIYNGYRNVLNKPWWYGAMLTVAVGAASLIVSIAGILGLAAGIVLRSVLKPKNTGYKRNPATGDFNIQVTLMLYVFALSVTMLLSSFPQTTMSTFTLNDKSKISGREISEKGGRILIVEEKSRKLAVVTTGHIATVSTCTTKQSLLTKSLIGASASREIVEECK